MIKGKRGNWNLKDLPAKDAEFTPIENNKEIHPYALTFPEMLPEEYSDLKQDIQNKGLAHPIMLHENKVLDGRHRYKACLELNITPTFIEYKGDDAFGYVVSTNKRRNLNKFQWAVIGRAIQKHYESIENTVKDRETGKFAKKTVCAMLHTRSSEKASVAIGKQASARLIDEVKMLESKAPEELENIKKGSKTINEVKHEIKKKELKERLKNVSEKELEHPTGLFDVIVIDPPWQLNFDPRPETHPQNAGLEYPTMSLHQIKELKLPADKDCHIFLWTVNSFLHEAFHTLEHWGAEFDAMFVWHKNGGYQVFGKPQTNCEFCLYAKIGKPKFIDTKMFFTCFSADRTGHSQKPECFYEVLRRVTGGRRLDMFNRRKIEGFVSWGKEAAK